MDCLFHCYFGFFTINKPVLLLPFFALLLALDADSTSQPSFKTLMDIDRSLSHRLQGNNKFPPIDIAMESWALITPVIEIGSGVVLHTDGLGDKTKGLYLSLGITGLTSLMVKYGVKRHRPDRHYRPRLWNSRYTPSFPSGHSASFAAYAAYMATTVPKSTPVMLGLTFLTGYSHVYVGNHYVSDVITGILFGGVIGYYFAVM